MSTDERPAPAQRMPPQRRGPGGGGPMMNMGMPGEKSMNFRGSARRFLGEMRGERWPLAAIVAMGTASVVLAVTGPKLLGNATNVIFAGVIGKQLPAGTTNAQAVEFLRSRGETTQANIVESSGAIPGVGIDFTQLRNILLVVLVIYLGSFLFGWLQGRMTAVVVQRVVYQMRQRVEAKLSRLPLKYHDGQPRGELLSRVTNDIDNVAQTLQQTLSQLITSVLTVIGVLAMMFFISPLLAVIALITVPLSMWIAGMIAKRSRPQFMQQWAVTGQLNAHIEEMYTGHSLVTVFGRQKEAAEVFAERNERLYESSFKAQFISGIIQPALGFVANLNYVIVAVVGGLQVASGALTLGSVQAFIQYSRQFTQPITAIASMANLLQSGVASVERVFELLDADEQEPDPVDAVQPDQPIQGRVAFENVAFSYSPDKPLIRDLSLVAEPGQTIAIVGPTGAGKTTLVNLLMRFYEVDNIAYGVEHATQEEIVEAAVATHVDRFVRTLPDGYETKVDDEGSNVSAGEKQLLTIARAFLADPAILILDEATSSVDTRTEVLVQQAMNALRHGRTSFVIAHRLSTIRDADTILVMEDGAIVEQGSHDQLLAADGAYARLYASQFAAAVAPVE
jgi:ATP-binding cassette subfamily B multidrug efflux pump